jgi:hypothetical protein
LWGECRAATDLFPVARIHINPIGNLLVALSNCRHLPFWLLWRGKCLLLQEAESPVRVNLCVLLDKGPLFWRPLAKHRRLTLLEVIPTTGSTNELWCATLQHGSNLFTRSIPLGHFLIGPAHLFLLLLDLQVPQLGNLLLLSCLLLLLHRLVDAGAEVGKTSGLTSGG